MTESASHIDIRTVNGSESDFFNEEKFRTFQNDLMAILNPLGNKFKSPRAIAAWETEKARRILEYGSEALCNAFPDIIGGRVTRFLHALGRSKIVTRSDLLENQKKALFALDIGRGGVGPQAPFRRAVTLMIDYFKEGGQLPPV